MSTGIIDSMLPCADSILGIRDSIGATIKLVYLVTRTWSGAIPGDGTAVDTEVQMLPSPGIQDLSQDLRIKEGGAVKAGDIFLRNVSRNSYTETQLDGSSASANIEKFYRVGDKLYQVISVTESYLTWKIQLRQMSNQTRY